MHRSKNDVHGLAYSITSSARSRNDSGIASPSALAVLRLMTSWYLDACSTGRSAGLNASDTSSSATATLRDLSQEEISNDPVDRRTHERHPTGDHEWPVHRAAARRDTSAERPRCSRYIVAAHCVAGCRRSVAR